MFVKEGLTILFLSNEQGWLGLLIVRKNVFRATFSCSRYDIRVCHEFLLRQLCAFFFLKLISHDFRAGHSRDPPYFEIEIRQPRGTIWYLLSCVVIFAGKLLLCVVICR